MIISSDRVSDAEKHALAEQLNLVVVGDHFYDEFGQRIEL